MDSGNTQGDRHNADQKPLSVHARIAEALDEIRHLRAQLGPTAERVAGDTIALGDSLWAQGRSAEDPQQALALLERARREFGHALTLTARAERAGVDSRSRSRTLRIVLAGIFLALLLAVGGVALAGWYRGHRAAQELAAAKQAASQAREALTDDLRSFAPDESGKAASAWSAAHRNESAEAYTAAAEAYGAAAQAARTNKAEHEPSEPRARQLERRVGLKRDSLREDVQQLAPVPFRRAAEAVSRAEEALALKRYADAVPELEKALELCEKARIEADKERDRDKLALENLRERVASERSQTLNYRSFAHEQSGRNVDRGARDNADRLWNQAEAAEKGAGKAGEDPEEAERHYEEAKDFYSKARSEYRKALDVP